jgi:hypothetical protein
MGRHQSRQRRKLRNQHMRTVAELLRRFESKQELDDEAKDMVSALYFASVKLMKALKRRRQHGKSVITG